LDILSLEFLWNLLIIISIDLMLAGDNAIVIALASRKLPKDKQQKAILWGTFGAIAIRIVATLALVSLLKIPWLHLVGGLLLVWIAYKLLVDNDDHDDGVKAGTSLGGAIRTIIIADALMGVDNVLAIAGASHGSYLLVVIGLLISIPVIMYGSTLFIKLIDRFPWILYVGSGILAYTASTMIASEKFFTPFFEQYPIVEWSLIIVIIAGVLITGKLVNGRRAKNRNEKEEDPSEEESLEEYDPNKQNA
jgi:YjbE family integral membrane protein